MTLADLLADVLSSLPPERRKAVEGLAGEYGADDNTRFLLSLVAGGNRRERGLVRRLLQELDQLDEQGKKPGGP